MPFRRLLPVLLLAGTWLVASAAQRLLLLWLTQGSTRPTSDDVLPLLLFATRTDLAWAAVIAVPLAPWLSLVPERLFGSRGHRGFLVALWVLGTAAILLFVTIDGFQFGVNHARLQAPVRQRLEVAWGALASPQARVGAGVAIVVGVLLATAGLCVLLRGPFRKSWGSLEPFHERMRDLLLVFSAGTLLFLTRPATPPFPDRPALDEVASTSVPAVVKTIRARLR